MSCLRWWVSGQVQGVSFRAATRDRALALGLCGYVHNLPDGRVAVYACGAMTALQALDQWLHQGPPAARVSQVEQATADDENPRGFVIRR
ncbi:acylphosphatase [Acidihalobacter yilgarnensis]|uniref:acylphosphatase n=1 Tax=Acidihalobacter yilgarnensis TaxID=2819280 RepID=A0A1D8IQ24_9GAMM|nr:acylphosphatase [Acidihalobacter yilgarnensis]AOU98600.1 acylphosphatase [Acidihalobacter yilgarnensis]